MLVSVKDANDVGIYININQITYIHPTDDPELSEVTFVGGKKIVLKGTLHVWVREFNKKGRT